MSSELLFGARRRGMHHDLPNGLGVFEARSEGVMGSAIEIAAQKTILRFYRPFMAQGRVDDAVGQMSGSSVQHLKFQLGLLTSRFRANHPLKACRRCMGEDRAKHGWAYWHLTHQFPGVWTCPEHGVPLVEGVVKHNGVERFAWHLPSEESLSDVFIRMDEAVHTAARKLSHITTALVQEPRPDGWLQAQRVQETIRRRLRAHGWLTDGGNIRLQASVSDYTAHCAALRVIPELSSFPSNQEQATTQLGRLLRPLRSGTHPLRLILLIDWLYDDAAEFMHEHDRSAEMAKQVSAVGVLGDAQGHTPVARRSNSHETLIALARSGVTATAAARELGIDVSTAMSWLADAGIAPRRRPKVLKDEVYASITSDLRQGVDRLAVATRYGVSVSTIDKTLRTVPGLHECWQNTRFNSARETARSLWTEVISSHPGLGVKLLRELCLSEYSWLYRNDREWLRTHSPRQGSTAPTRSITSVQWDSRDAELSVAVRSAALALKRDQGKRRLRLWQLFQLVPELRAKLGSLDRLPLTKAAIDRALDKHSTLGSDSPLFPD